MTPVVLVPTYARVRYLEEQLACLLAQDHPCEVVVVNDCPWQKLCFTGELGGAVIVVRCLNAEQFVTLGEKRNAMLALAGGRMVTWADDDDLTLPWYISGLVSAADEGFAEETTRWDITGNEWSRNTRPWPLARLGRAAAWLKAGGATDTSIGEDKALMDTHRAACTHARATMGHLRNLGSPGYVYRFGQPRGDVYHLSGKGTEDGCGYRADAERRREQGSEPTGTIHLEPRLRRYYWREAPFEVQKRLERYNAHRWQYDLSA